jgi:hypothetical protein
MKATVKYNKIFRDYRATMTVGSYTVATYGPTPKEAATLAIRLYHGRTRFLNDTGQQHGPWLPDCLTCGDTGYVDTDLLCLECSAPAGSCADCIYNDEPEADRWQEEYYAEMERDYAEAQYEQQTAGYF